MAKKGAIQVSRGFKLNPITRVNRHHRKMLDIMVTTMDRLGSRGLAAPQIGVFLPLIVMRDRNGKVLKFVSPTMKSSSEIHFKILEGCCSYEYLWGTIPRLFEVEVQDLLGGNARTVLKSEDAVVFQHQYDHLQDVIISDYWLNHNGKSGGSPYPKINEPEGPSAKVGVVVATCGT